MSTLSTIRAELPLILIAATLAVAQSVGVPATGLAGAGVFLWLLIVMIWAAGGVLHHAESVAERLGEPLGTLILTLAVVGIEVALIASVMLSGDGSPTLARDTMFAVVMIVLNFLTGLSLLLGALRFGEQNYNLAGARAFLSLMLPLAVFSMVLPAYTTSSWAPTFTDFQALFFSVVTIALYFVFLLMQTVRHRGYFMEPEEPMAPELGHAHYATGTHALLMFATLVPIVLLSKTLAKFVDQGLDTLGLVFPLPFRVAFIVVAAVWGWAVNLHYLYLLRIDVPALIRYPARSSPSQPPHHVSTYRLASLLSATLAAFVLLFGLLSFVTLETVTAPSAEAVEATGGDARFKSIQWFSWGAEGAQIPNGGLSRTETYTIAGQSLALTCSLSNINRASGTGTGNHLASYRPGAWQGDGFDELYNIGGPNENNRMVVGLTNRTDANRITFDFSCSAKLGTVDFPLAGLVMADAEVRTKLVDDVLAALKADPNKIADVAPIESEDTEE